MWAQVVVLFSCKWFCTFRTFTRAVQLVTRYRSINADLFVVHCELGNTFQSATMLSTVLTTCTSLAHFSRRALMCNSMRHTSTTDVSLDFLLPLQPHTVRDAPPIVYHPVRTGPHTAQHTTNMVHTGIQCTTATYRASLSHGKHDLDAPAPLHVWSSICDHSTP